MGERFLKGPVPLPWLETAARLPGKSLHTGVALWYVAGLTRSPTVPLSNIAGERFGLDRNAKYRALEWLARALVERSMFVVHLSWDARLSPLRADPRFTALIGRLAIPPRPGGAAVGAAG